MLTKIQPTNRASTAYSKSCKIAEEEEKKERELRAG
jgi:hypothetical protein